MKDKIVNLVILFFIALGFALSALQFVAILKGITILFSMSFNLWGAVSIWAAVMIFIQLLFKGGHKYDHQDD